SCCFEETAMRALTIAPGIKDSARLDDVPEPSAEEGAVLVEGLVMGVCGTDRELVEGLYGWAPPGRSRLVLGPGAPGPVLEALAAAPRPGDRRRAGRAARRPARRAARPRRPRS